MTIFLHWASIYHAGDIPAHERLWQRYSADMLNTEGINCPNRTSSWVFVWPPKDCEKVVLPHVEGNIRIWMQQGSFWIDLTRKLAPSATAEENLSASDLTDLTKFMSAQISEHLRFCPVCEPISLSFSSFFSDHDSAQCTKQLVSRGKRIRAWSCLDIFLQTHQKNPVAVYARTSKQGRSGRTNFWRTEACKDLSLIFMTGINVDHKVLFVTQMCPTIVADQCSGTWHERTGSPRRELGHWWWMGILTKAPLQRFRLKRLSSLHHSTARDTVTRGMVKSTRLTVTCSVAGTEKRLFRRQVLRCMISTFPESTPLLSQKWIGENIFKETVVEEFTNCQRRRPETRYSKTISYASFLNKFRQSKQSLLGTDNPTDWMLSVFRTKGCYLLAAQCERERLPDSKETYNSSAMNHRCQSCGRNSRQQIHRKKGRSLFFPLMGQVKDNRKDFLTKVKTKVKSRDDAPREGFRIRGAKLQLQACVTFHRSFKVLPVIFHCSDAACVSFNVTYLQRQTKECFRLWQLFSKNEPWQQPNSCTGCRFLCGKLTEVHGQTLPFIKKLPFYEKCKI